ncbi:MAG: PEP-CTERM sorting domain-containing protein, partial [Planctomycetes bacterium]|nr:PEP-CTERM sorting domain-containing protein [Planctomycetota bacterium]
GLHSTDQNHDMWDTTANKPIQFVNFNLNGNYDLGNIHVWQWLGGSANIKAAQNVEILVADTFNGPLTSLGDFVFPIGPGGNTPDPGFDIDVSGFGATADVAQVQFVITTNWVDVDPIGNPGGGGWPMGDTSVHNNARTGMAEVQFFESSDVPEPSTFVLAALGLFGLALFVRRRRR